MANFLRKLKKFTSPWPILFILTATIAVIFYGRGYRPDFQNNQIKPTGLLSATSQPVGSQVYVDGLLKTATNNPVNLDPGWYTVKITKEGYIAWEKHLRVQGEVVTRTDAFLFPTSPSLSPLTNTGVEKPLLSPDGTKIVFIIPTSVASSSKRAGLWVYELTERPLGLNRDPRQLGTTTAGLDFSKAIVRWSPDSSQVLADFGSSVRLYEAGNAGQFEDVSATYPILLREWEDSKNIKLKQQLSAFKQGFIDVATSSAKIIALSPDENKILYEATSSATLPQIMDPPLIGTNPTEEHRQIEPGKLYVYDAKEDKNYFLLDKNEVLTHSSNPSPTPKQSPRSSANPASNSSTNSQLPSSNYDFIRWFPTSRHLVLSLPGKIDILEYDRTNWITVYSGPFVDGFFAPWPNGSRIILMTNLNPGQSTLPNLYTVNLR